MFPLTKVPFWYHIFGATANSPHGSVQVDASVWDVIPAHPRPIFFKPLTDFNSCVSILNFSWG